MPAEKARNGGEAAEAEEKKARFIVQGRRRPAWT